MIRIISLNLNGIRSAARKGLLPWLESCQADVGCVQELKDESREFKSNTRALNDRMRARATAPCAVQ